MIELAVSQNQISFAKETSLLSPSLKNSIRGQSAFAIGVLGEILVSQYLGVKFPVSPEIYLKSFDLNYDIIFMGRTIEVKTKTRARDPEPHWMATVSCYSSHQQPDLYAFCSLTCVGERKVDNVKRAWLCGFYDAKKFKQNCKLMKAGEYDHGFRAKRSQYYVDIRDLKML